MPSRILVLLAALWAVLATVPAHAETFSALARAKDTSRILDQRGELVLRLDLTQGVPWRIYTLDAPRRVVMDFREVDFGALPTGALGESRYVKTLRYGALRPGWSRLVMELAEPMQILRADIAVGEGGAELVAKLAPVAADTFAKLAGAPHDPKFDLPPVAITAPPRKSADAPLVVVLDPGHGGIDPGAERKGVVEKDLMLTFARELRDALRRAGGFQVVMTRDADVFVSLERRVAIAHQSGADVFISLHADTITKGHASGATVYTLSKNASDAASALLAERHNRADILSGVDLTGSDDLVADVLMDLARLETRPRTERLARAMVLGMDRGAGPINRHPYRSAAFSVLKAADIPSVLIEVGFLSSDSDLANLQNPTWRANMAAGIRDGLLAWIIADRATRDLVRQ